MRSSNAWLQTKINLTFSNNKKRISKAEKSKDPISIYCPLRNLSTLKVTPYRAELSQTKSCRTRRSTWYSITRTFGPICKITIQPPSTITYTWAHSGYPSSATQIFHILTRLMTISSSSLGSNNHDSKWPTSWMKQTSRLEVISWSSSSRSTAQNTLRNRLMKLSVLG